MTAIAVRRFTFHYLEMVVVMLLGMLVLGGAATVALGAAGVEVDKLELELLGMAVTMTAPMVAWMRHRGHRWTPTIEMGAAMVLPTFAAIGLLWAGIMRDPGGLMALEHTAMFTGMFAVMLARAGEYTGRH
jgi:predicted anti-sigma-YlaC factor YlaD